MINIYIYIYKYIICIRIRIWMLQTLVYNQLFAQLKHARIAPIIVNRVPILYVCLCTVHCTLYCAVQHKMYMCMCVCID